MEDIIHLLPDSVANQIAAGEVVQRPASIIKELVENSLDAKAKNIHVLVTDGGRTCVQVIDDGIGMSETDARLAFERHATSKILCAADLFSLSTMGFRGEALASIAAVAQVTLKTRRAEDELGTELQISGSKVERQEPVACPVGSNFSVSNLFYNVPARRKFLKSNQTELSNIVADFERIVLTHPEVSFTLYSNGSEMLRLPETTVRQRIADVFGKKLNAELLPLEVDTSLVSVSGFVAGPEFSKKKGAHKFFFVNGRFMRHPYFHTAVMQAYENLIPVGNSISYFIYLSVDPAAIDVNVHPTKTEIKFDNEQAIWQVIAAAVKESVGKYSSVPTIDFDVEDKPDIPAFDQNAVVAPPIPIQTTFNPFKPGNYSSSGSGSGSDGASGSFGTHHKSPVQKNWEQLYIEPEQPTATQPLLWQEDEKAEEAIDLAVPHFQYKGRYIVMPTQRGVMFIDQHRAHIKVLFEQYMETLFQQKRVSQGVLFPEIVQFSKQESLALEDIMDDLEYIGFDLCNLGGGSFSINGTPSGIDGINPSALLHDLIYAAIETGCSVKEKVHKAIALTMAKAAAIVYGQVLSEDEIKLLLEQLFGLSTPRFTPDGLLVYSVVDHTVIEHDFK